MNSKQYLSGNIITVTCTTRLEATGALVNPTQVVFKKMFPNRSITTVSSPDITITNPSVGVWLYTPQSTDISTGIYWIKFTPVGGGLGASEDYYEIIPSVIT